VTKRSDEERWVAGSNAGWGATASRDPDREASIARAEELFASLTEQAEQKRQVARSQPASPQRVVTAPETADPVPTDVPPLTDQEVRDLFVAARAASERTGTVVKAVRSQASAASADLVAIGEAIEEALAATNERLAALERFLPVEAEPDAEAPEWAAEALDRLARTVRRARGRSSGGAAARAPRV